MIQKFVDKFMENEGAVRARLASAHPREYRDVVRLAVEHVADEDEYGRPDPGRVHEIDDGEYQGTLVYVVGASGYQPSEYWYARVSYGSCSGCDTLQAISGYGSDAPTPGQVDDYWALTLHVVQGMTAMQEDWA